MVFDDGIALLVLTSATEADFGEYTCEAVNAVGSASSTCLVDYVGKFR